MTSTLIKENPLLGALYERRNKIYLENDYQNIEFDPKCGITKEEIQDFIDFLNSRKSYTIKDIRSKALYLAIKYEFSIDSFWAYIMYKTGKWKKPKK